MPDASAEGVELVLLGAEPSQPEVASLDADRLIPASWTLPPPSAWPPRAPTRRRSMLTEVASRESQRGSMPKCWKAKLTVVLYTFARIVANLVVFARVYTHYQHWLNGSCGKLDEWACRQRASSYSTLTWGLLCDSILRPLVTGLGLYVLLHRSDRLSAKSPLHLLTRAVLFCLASFHCDFSVTQISGSSNWNDGGGLWLLLPWEVLCNSMQLHMTNLKLHALGWQLTAQVCKALMLGMLLAWSAWGFLWGYFRYGPPGAEVSFYLCPMLLILEFVGLFYSASRALFLGWQDDAIRATAWCLYINSLLLWVGPVLSFCGFLGFHYGQNNATNVDPNFWYGLFQTTKDSCLTLDIGFQVVNVLLLSGIVGPRQWQEPMAAFQRLADLQGFGLASKRIAFPGRLNPQSEDCVVSFPGKYSQQWDKAVSTAKTQQGFSLACVFLTDRASGLGEHVENPDAPGECWCHAIYGQLPASTYLAVVDVRPESAGCCQVLGGLGRQGLSQQDLEFKRADAEAMGQRLVVRRNQADWEWERELREAEEDARRRCAENQGLAPWGCKWFEDWRRNVQRAVELKQSLHVFYFEGRTGQGKLDWDQLPCQEAKERVRLESGLGASQTAEVAYLDKMGYAYVEHDIRNFHQLVSPASTASAEPDQASQAPAP
ncbi:GIP [Symbiodinium sp. CCMP2592]|nr:GIP [Symbiodinium sp. CCMP2592]